MTFRTYVYDRFSPYLDDDPWVDFFDDVAQRATTVIAAVLAVHFALFFVLNANFIVPDLKEEPDPIPVQIIAFEDLQPAPAPETEPEIIDVAPVVPPPPRPKPAPQPVPTPQPAPVETVIAEPVIEPAPVPSPAPEILASEAPVDTQEVIPEYRPPEPIAEPIIEPPVIPAPIPTPEPLPDVEIFEPLTQPTPEPIIEPEPPEEFEVEIFEPQPITPEPIIQEPVINEPIFEPEPVIEPEPIIEPVEPEPVEVYDPFAEIENEPLPDVIRVTPQIDLTPEEDDPFPEFTPPSEPLPEPEPETKPAPAPIEPDVAEPELEDAPIITTAPTILASPEAPTTIDEAEKAVPQEQAAPVNDFLFNPKPRQAPTAPNSGTRRPSAPSSGNGRSGSPSSGAISLDGGGGIPSGGTQRTPTQRGGGNAGWALAPAGGSGGLGKGGEGLILDIRCREAKRTHADCPAYLAKFKGRNAAGYESFSPHSSGGVSRSTSGARAGTLTNRNVGGGRDPWSANLGDNSINAGGPSTTVLDDTSFGQGLGPRLEPIGEPDRVRDLIKQPDRPWETDAIELPTADGDEDGE